MAQDASQLSDQQLLAIIGEQPQQPRPQASPRSSSAPRGIRNNNPGNIEDGPFARSLPGYAGSDGRFARFDNPEAGDAAKARLLGSYIERGFNTPNKIINRWAPPSENDSASYARFVADRVGIGPDDVVTPDMIPAISAAIYEMENGRPAPNAGGDLSAMPDDELLALLGDDSGDVGDDYVPLGATVDENGFLVSGQGDQWGTAQYPHRLVKGDDAANAAASQGIKQGDWIEVVDPQTGSVDRFRATSDAYMGGRGDNIGGVQLNEVGLGDQIGAAAQAASEQIPFLDESVALTTGLLTGRGYGAMRDAQRQTAAIDNASQGMRGARVAGGFGGFGLGLLAPGGAFIGRGATVADRAGRAAGLGAGYGALYGAGASDDRVSGALEGAALGGLSGGAMQLGGDRLARMVRDRASARAANPSPQRILSNSGVELTPGQILGGFAQRVEDAATSVPILGDAINSARRRGLGTYMDALTRETLEPVGGQVASQGRQRMVDARQSVTDVYNAALDRVSSVPKQEGFDDALAAIVANPRLSRTDRAALRSFVADLGERTADEVDGRFWKDIDSQLSTDIHNARTAASSSPEKRFLAEALEQARDLWAERLNAVAPDVLADVRTADDAFANLKILEGATSSASSAARGGDATPAAVSQAVRRGAGASRYARGTGRLQGLADAGSQVLPATIPDSGTLTRSLFTAGGIGGGMTALGGAGPEAAAMAATGIGIGSIPYLQPVSRQINRLYRATGREDVSRQMAAGLEEARQNPALIPLYAEMLERLREDQPAPPSVLDAMQNQQPARVAGR